MFSKCSPSTGLTIRVFFLYIYKTLINTLFLRKSYLSVWLSYTLFSRYKLTPKWLYFSRTTQRWWYNERIEYSLYYYSLSFLFLYINCIITLVAFMVFRLCSTYHRGICDNFHHFRLSSSSLSVSYARMGRIEVRIVLRETDKFRHHHPPKIRSCTNVRMKRLRWYGPCDVIIIDDYNSIDCEFAVQLLCCDGWRDWGK